MKKLQCGACEKKFYSLPAFDAHRTGKYRTEVTVSTRRCMDTLEMLEKGMWKDKIDKWHRSTHFQPFPGSRQYPAETQTA